MSAEPPRVPAGGPAAGGPSPDWRLLLGHARWHQVAVVGEGRGPIAVGRMSERAPAMGTVPPGTDLVVLAAPLHRLPEGLTPASQLAVTGHGAAATRAATKRLAGTDLVGTATYVGWPSRRPRRWIPVGDAHAMAWLARQVDPRGVGQFARWLRWLAWRARDRLGRTPLVVFFGPSQRAHGSSVPTLLPPGSPLGTFLRRTVSNLDQRTVAVAGGGSRWWSKSVLFILRPRSTEPEFVLKVGQASDATAGLHREAEVLTGLARAQGGSPSGVPALLGRTDFEGHVGLLESAVPGVTWAIGPRTSTSELAAITDAATDWLISLARVTRRAEDESASRDLALSRALKDFAAAFGGTVQVPESQVSALTHALAGLPVVLEHRDFAPWNLLRSTSGDLGVTDWESADPMGWPLRDLIYFLAYLTFAAEGATTPERQVEVYRRSSAGVARTGALAQHAIARYAAALGTDPRLVAPLRASTWATHAMSEHRRAVDDFGPQPDPGRLGAGLFVRLWQVDSDLLG